MRMNYLAAGFLALTVFNVMAEEPASATQVDTAAALSAHFERLGLPAQVRSVEPSALPGVMQVMTSTGRVLYASEDGALLLEGALLDISGERMVNLTARVEAESVRDAVNNMPRDELVIFGADEPKTHITVFTDVDCGYCRVLHQEVEELNQLGIEVRYAAFPRSGPNEASAATMQSIWCADDRQAAMTLAKAGEPVEPKTCDNPVVEQLLFGQQLGVKGTPAIFFANGVLQPGYTPAATLAAEALANQ
ncbi:MAG: protein-disulfide isomerase [Gammaproteobacteria bacterium HGW-Gammaproteobacteria-11]|nr:MAG: protein-disulfide isomerase [Gammaproteobacteria bacterium HGW-Gammaproteobacteria-11]